MNAPVEPLVLSEMRRDAVLSADGRYRYRLTRTWRADATEPLVFCMLNPSTADGGRNDATTVRCCHIAYRLGYPGIVIVNLFAYRATAPNALKKAILDYGFEYAQGGDNPLYVEQAFYGRDVVLAWGIHGRALAPARSDSVERMAKRDANAVYCLKRLANGIPAHPLVRRSGLGMLLRM